MKEKWKYFWSGALLVGVVMFFQMPKNSYEDCVAVAEYIEDPSSVKLTAHEKRVALWLQHAYRASAPPFSKRGEVPMTYMMAYWNCRSAPPYHGPPSTFR